jgi:hypothetical protein
MLATMQFRNFLSSHLSKKNGQNIVYIRAILPVILYGCESWSLMLMQEHRFRVSDNRVLRRIFGPKRDEVTGGRKKKLHNEVHEAVRCTQNILLGKPEGKRPFRRPRSRYEDNIKMDLT